MNVGRSHHFVVRNDLITSLLGRRSDAGLAAVVDCRGHPLSGAVWVPVPLYRCRTGTPRLSAVWGCCWKSRRRTIREIFEGRFTLNRCFQAACRPIWGVDFPACRV